MTNHSVNSIDLVTCRVKVCPYNPKFQQILTYSRIRQVNKKRNSHRIQSIFAHGNKDAIKKLYWRVNRRIYDIDPKCANERSLYIWRKNIRQDSPIFSENCTKRSFCHIAQKYQQNHDIIKPGNENFQSYCKTIIEPLESSQYFAMHICINNQPGTIYALTYALANSEFNRKRKFDFNLDHLRSTLCRAENCVKINLYGHYRKSESINFNDAITNVKAITFYDLRRNNEIKEILESRLRLKSRKLVDDAPGDIQAFYRGDIHNSDKAGDPIDCPIARFVPCPGHSNNSSTQIEGDILKIMACICDEPGSLRELAGLIAIKNFF